MSEAAGAPRTRRRARLANCRAAAGVRPTIGDEAARHYDESALAALILAIATTNVFNRLNVATKQVAGVWG